MDIVQKIQAQLKANENDGVVLLQGFGLTKFDTAWISGSFLRLRSSLWRYSLIKFLAAAVTY